MHESLHVHHDKREQSVEKKKNNMQLKLENEMHTAVPLNGRTKIVTFLTHRSHYSSPLFSSNHLQSWAPICANSAEINESSTMVYGLIDVLEFQYICFRLINVRG